MKVKNSLPRLRLNGLKITIKFNFLPSFKTFLSAINWNFSVRPFLDTHSSGSVLMFVKLMNGEEKEKHSHTKTNSGIFSSLFPFLMKRLTLGEGKRDAVAETVPCVYCTIDSVTLHIKKFSLFYCCENQIRMFAKGKIGAHKIDWVREYDTSVCVYVSKCFSVFVIFKLRFNIFFSSFYFESNSFLMYTISLSCFPKNTWKLELFGLRLLRRGKSSWFSKKIHRFIFKAE